MAFSAATFTSPSITSTGTLHRASEHSAIVFCRALQSVDPSPALKSHVAECLRNAAVAARHNHRTASLASPLIVRRL